MNAEKIKNKSVGISLEEYKCELELMKKQYGQEEELYPWIYMILREAGITKKYSVRSVAGARSAKDVNGRELFMGYAAFPDIAIVDKSFMSGEEYNYEVEIDKLLCCVEAKELSESLLNVKGDVCIKSLNVIYIKSSLGRPYYIYYKIIADTQVVDFFDRYSFLQLVIAEVRFFQRFGHEKLQCFQWIRVYLPAKGLQIGNALGVICQWLLGRCFRFVSSCKTNKNSHDDTHDNNAGNCFFSGKMRGPN